MNSYFFREPRGAPKSLFRFWIGRGRYPLTRIRQLLTPPRNSWLYSGLAACRPGFRWWLAHWAPGRHRRSTRTHAHRVGVRRRTRLPAWVGGTRRPGPTCGARRPRRWCGALEPRAPDPKPDMKPDMSRTQIVRGPGGGVGSSTARAPRWWSVLVSAPRSRRRFRQRAGPGGWWWLGTGAQRGPLLKSSPAIASGPWVTRPLCPHGWNVGACYRRTKKRARLLGRARGWLVMLSLSAHRHNHILARHVVVCVNRPHEHL